jgi:hypothetical protein
VVLSNGPNAPLAAPGADEAHNLDADGVFVARDPSIGAGDSFDDLLQWGAIHLVVHRMVSAGRLP